MSIANPGAVRASAYAHAMGYAPLAGPKSVAFVLPFGKLSVSVLPNTIDLFAEKETGQFDLAQSVFIDNGDINLYLYLTIVGTQQRIKFPPKSQGYLQMPFTNGLCQFNAVQQSGAQVDVPMLVLNIPVASYIWATP